MKTLYRTTVRFETHLFTTEKTFLFASAADRDAFEDASGGCVVASGWDDIVTPDEALALIRREIAIHTELAGMAAGDV